METIYKWPFDEAKAQYAIDTLFHDKPWKLWSFEDKAGGRYYDLPDHPLFRCENDVYKRTEPKDGNNL